MFKLKAMIDDNSRNNDIFQRLATILGIGLVIATAMTGLVGDIAQFKNGRWFAAFQHGWDEPPDSIQVVEKPASQE